MTPSRIFGLCICCIAATAFNCIGPSSDDKDGRHIASLFVTFIGFLAGWFAFG